MKRLFIILMTIIFLAGCSSTPASPNKSATAQNTAVSMDDNAGSSNATSGSAESSNNQQGDTNVPSTENTVSQENSGTVQTVSINGEDTNFTLHSIDFLDAGMGWLIQERYNSHSDTMVSQLLATKDGGVHWSNMTPDQAGAGNTVYDKVLFIDENTGWVIFHNNDGNTAGSDSSAVQYGIIHTVDGGASWNIQWQGKQTAASEFDLWFQDKSDGFALVGNVLLATRDGGHKWSTVTTGIAGFSPQHMSFTDANTGWVIGTVGQDNIVAVLNTTDGGASWKQQFNKKYQDGPVGSIDVDFIDADTGWFLTSDMATWNGELYHTDNGGSDWKKINDIKCVRPTPMSLDFITSKAGWIPLDVGAGPIDGGLMYTVDGGKSFNVVGRSQEEDPSYEQKIMSASEIDFTSDREGFAVGRNINTGEFLIRTDDGGKTWTQVYPKPMPCQDISFADNLHGFGIGQHDDSRALLYTDDGGSSWKSIKSFAPDYWPQKLSFIDRDNGWILAVTAGSNKLAVLRTSDGGRTWNEIYELPEMEASYFKFFDVNNGILVQSGKTNSIFSTKDGGKTWKTTAINQPADGTSQYSFISAGEGWEICNPGNYKTGYDVKISHLAEGSTWQTPTEVEKDAWVYAFSYLSGSRAMMLVEEPPYKPDSLMKLMTTEDGGKTWNSMDFPEGINGGTLVMLQNLLPMQFTDDMHGWILSAHGLLATTDGGRTWTWK